jgi:surface antigen
MSNDKLKVSGVTYTSQSSDYYEKRELKRSAGLFGLWGLAVAAVMSLAPTTGGALADTYWQCVPFARLISGIQLFGDAYTWWDKAAGKYPRGALPEPGAVMVLNNYAGADRAHVAVVRRVMGPREIRVDHANWLDDGSIYINNPVEDVSGDNDWSVVRVYNLKTGGWGSRLYPVQGFIAPGAPARQKDNAAPGPMVDSGGSSMGATSLIGDLN